MNITPESLRATREKYGCGLYDARKILLKELMNEHLAKAECDEYTKEILKILVEHFR